MIFDVEMLQPRGAAQYAQRITSYIGSEGDKRAVAKAARRAAEVSAGHREAWTRLGLISTLFEIAYCDVCLRSGLRGGVAVSAQGRRVQPRNMPRLALGQAHSWICLLAISCARYTEDRHGLHRISAGLVMLDDGRVVGAVH